MKNKQKFEQSIEKDELFRSTFLTAEQKDISLQEMLSKLQNPGIWEDDLHNFHFGNIGSYYKNTIEYQQKKFFRKDFLFKDGCCKLEKPILIKQILNILTLRTLSYSLLVVFVGKYLFNSKAWAMPIDQASTAITVVGGSKSTERQRITTRGVVNQTMTVQAAKRNFKKVGKARKQEGLIQASAPRPLQVGKKGKGFIPEYMQNTVDDPSTLKNKGSFQFELEQVKYHADLDHEERIASYDQNARNRLTQIRFTDGVYKLKEGEEGERVIKKLYSTQNSKECFTIEELETGKRLVSLYGKVGNFDQLQKLLRYSHELTTKKEDLYILDKQGNRIFFNLDSLRRSNYEIDHLLPHVYTNALGISCPRGEASDMAPAIVLSPEENKFRTLNLGENGPFDRQYSLKTSSWTNYLDAVDNGNKRLFYKLDDLNFVSTISLLRDLDESRRNAYRYKLLCGFREGLDAVAEVLCGEAERVGDSSNLFVPRCELFRYGDKLEKASTRLRNNMRVINPNAKQIEQQKEDGKNITFHFTQFTEAASHFEKLCKNEDSRIEVAQFFQKTKWAIVYDMELCRINRPNMPEFAEFGKVVQNTTFNRIVNPDIDEIDDIFKDAGVHKMYVEPFIKNQTNQEDD
jgi:hypothetical protein